MRASHLLNCPQLKQAQFALLFMNPAALPVGTWAEEASCGTLSLRCSNELLLAGAPELLPVSLLMACLHCVEMSTAQRRPTTHFHYLINPDFGKHLITVNTSTKNYNTYL